MEETKKTELYLPSFQLKMDGGVPELEGLRLSETQRIKAAKIQCSIEVTNAKAQEEGLLQEGVDMGKAVVMDQSFVFILTNAELEEKVDSMPLFVAKVTPGDFIAYWLRLITS